jgi:hypothetical protein
MPLVLLVGLASAGVVREAERSTSALKPGRDRTEFRTEETQRSTARKRGPSVLLTGSFGGLTDDDREFLLCLADEGPLLTGWGEPVAGWAVVSYLVGSVPANSDPEEKGGSRWGGRRW